MSVFQKRRHSSDWTPTAGELRKRERRRQRAQDAGFIDHVDDPRLVEHSEAHNHDDDEEGDRVDQHRRTVVYGRPLVPVRNAALYTYQEELAALVHVDDVVEEEPRNDVLELELSCVLHSRIREREQSKLPSSARTLVDRFDARLLMDSLDWSRLRESSRSADDSEADAALQALRYEDLYCCLQEHQAEVTHVDQADVEAEAEVEADVDAEAEAERRAKEDEQEASGATSSLTARDATGEVASKSDIREGSDQSKERATENREDGEPACREEGEREEGEREEGGEEEEEEEAQHTSEEITLEASLSREDTKTGEQAVHTSERVQHDPDDPAVHSSSPLFRVPIATPAHMITPTTVKHYEVIAHTARYVAAHGLPFALALRTRNRGNPLFDFMDPDDVLHPFFLFLQNPDQMREEHLSQLCAQPPSEIACFPSDAAGQATVRKVATLVLEHGLPLEKRIRESVHPEYAFTEPAHLYHAYYCWVKKTLREETM